MTSCQFDLRSSSACKDSPVIGFDFCPFHLASPRGLQHAQDRIRTGPMFTVEDLESEITRRTDVPEADYHTSALEKMDQVLSEVLDWEQDAKRNLYQIPREDWRFTDRTNGEQTRMEVGVYERALDRSSRVLKDVSKMALSDKIVSLGRSQTELMIRIMMRVLTDLHLSAEAFDRGRQTLLIAFQEEGNLSGRVEDSVTKELTSDLNTVDAEVVDA